LLAGLAPRAEATNVPPNIVFILADDLGKEWISAYGASDISTPNLDSLASTGIRFDNFYGMPQCTPSRVALLTGKYPWRNGWVNHWDVPAWGIAHFDWRTNINTSVFRLLREEGYTTAVAGKWQVNDFRIEPEAMWRHGFDDWFMWTGVESDNPPSSARYYDPYIQSREGRQTYTGAFGPDLYSGFLIDFIRRNKDRPFAVYYAMTLPHTPFTHTPDEPLATLPNDLAKHKAMVRYMDKMVGNIITTLEQEGIRNRTVVIFTTDNGSTAGITGTRNGRPVSGAKQQLTEAGACLPFIANGPGLVPTGVVSDVLVDFTDLMPTFLALAGSSVPTSIVTDGHSFAPVLLGQATTNTREWILSTGGNPGKTNASGQVVNVDFYDERALRDKRFKVRVNTNRVITALYDLQEDPWELTNRNGSASAIHTNARAKFRAILDTQIPFTDANPAYTPWTLDTDGDGIPDNHETGTGVFAGPTDTGTLAHDSDTDGDGWSDGVELQLGTDPNEAGYFPQPAGDPVEVRVPMQHFVVVSLNGTATNPLTGAATNGFPANVTTNDLFVRQRTDGAQPEQRARLFLRFDLSGVTNSGLTDAKLLLHQYNRSESPTNHSPIEVSRVTASWNLSGTNFPLYGASVAGNRIIATNDLFGTIQNSPGVYTGSVTDIAAAWLNNSAANNGFRVALTYPHTIRTAFSRQDDPGTPAQDESPALVLTFGGTGNPDTDGDGLPDAWEVFRFGSITNSNGVIDSDGDGANDREEYLANSNPTNSQSAFEITSFRFAPGAVRVNYDGHPSRRYTLSASTNGLTNWTPLKGNLIPTPPLSEAAVNAPTGALHFYRLDAKPAP